MTEPENRSGYVGKRRARSTRNSVRVADRTAQALITLGGIGTIIAVSLVSVFLIWVVLPLFTSESLESPQSVEFLAEARPVHVASDEYLSIGWSVTEKGSLRSFRIDSGEVLETQSLFPEGRYPSAWSFSRDTGHLAFGFADGTVQLGIAEFKTEFIPDEEIHAELRKLKPGELGTFRDGVVQVTPENQFRYQKLVITLEEPVTVKEGVSIELIDLSISTNGEIFAVLTADAELRLARVTRRKNLLTGKTTTRLREGTLAIDLPKDAGKPSFLMLAGLGDSVALVWDDGRLLRYDTRNTTQPVFAEEIDVAPGDTQVTALSFLIGKTSLVVGDSKGGVSVWFRVKPDEAATPDGSVLRIAHALPSGSAPVAALAPSTRSRLMAAGFQDGQVHLYHVTSQQKFAASSTTQAKTIHALAVGPKDDALVSLSESGLSVWAIDAPHPETTLSTIFTPVWYEGYESRENVWQSSSGTDDFEPKYGLVPLVFGSIKATFYSMLFGAPLALLAAVYTSEFLVPRIRSRVKPTIEIMASLPSVVLGFLAALVFAPMVEDVVPEMLASFVTLPFSFLVGSYLWQVIPLRLALRLDSNPIVKLSAMLLMVPVGLFLAAWLGPVVEDWLFAGDIKAWLDGQTGDGTGGWMIVLFPLSALATAVAVNLIVTPRMRKSHLGRVPFALLDFVKFLAGCAGCVLVAWGVSTLLNSAGWDPRGTFVDTYVQRNALVVGFIMGFAIIPIIYTISDDALSAVPESLRAGSLGSGATPWQTAIRIIIPTAMSGLFSAVMIGLGRAVGETMIVLMAAGNTPVMDWNIFNGFRTLSANIAVELPEAVKDSTHYRMLFLAALSLFALTFVLNTAAEVVRLRFRKRAFQL
jgi:phosphate transport system permease protein